MKDIINGLTERFRRQHVQARRYVAMMLVLALLTTLFVNWQLHGVGITMTADYHCGYEEHQHTAACYEKSAHLRLRGGRAGNARHLFGQQRRSGVRLQRGRAGRAGRAGADRAGDHLGAP